MATNKRSRGWCFTLFSFHANHVLILRGLVERNDARYVIFGRERCPRSGRRHLQGYVYFQNPLRMAGVKSLLGDEFGGIHLESAKGTPEQNRVYCSKESDFEEFGELPRKGRRSDLRDIQAKIDAGASERAIAEEFFSQWVVYRRSFAAYRSLVREPEMRPELKVFVLVGSPGIGKTRFAYGYAQANGGSAFMSPDPTLQWFDGYRGEEVAILDDYRGDGNFAFLLRLLDIYPLRVPIKGGYVDWRPRTIFITSNKLPPSWHPEDDYRALRRRLTRIVDVDGGPVDESFEILEKWILDVLERNE